jgi:hypothetical protein
VCGRKITDVDVDHAHSALEALCVSPKGNQRLQLARQLLTAALNGAGGGAKFTDFAACNAICTNAASSKDAVTGCTDEADKFNNSGDNIPAPFDNGTSATPGPCKDARGTDCTIFDPGLCAAP